MIINTNMGSSTAARILADNSSALQKSLKRLTTGNKIASVADNAAGVAVASKLSAEIERIGASKDNLGNLISFAQTQDGYMDKVSGALQRMSELAMLATDETKSDSDRALYNSEFIELQEFIGTMTSKQFNGISLFSSDTLAATVGLNSAGSAITFGVGAVNLGDTPYTNVIAQGTASITNAAVAANALSVIQTAIGELATDRAVVGSNMSRLDSEKAALSILKDNLSSARSRIVDVDVAEESANFAKQQILVQSGTAMLAQANILPQAALRLIS